MRAGAGNTGSDEHNSHPKIPSRGGRLMVWLKRLGVGGFVFFLVKGLLWLLVPYIIAKVW